MKTCSVDKYLIKSVVCRCKNLFLIALLTAFAISLFTLSSKAQSSGCPNYCKSHLEYAVYGIKKIFSGQAWSFGQMSDDPIYRPTDASWFTRYLNLKGKTDSGLNCHITIYDGEDQINQISRPVIYYSDSSGVEILQKGNSLDSTRSSYDPVNSISNVEVYYDGGMNCGIYGCDSPYHTTAKITAARIELVNLLGYSPNVSCNIQNK